MPVWPIFLNQKAQIGQNVKTFGKYTFLSWRPKYLLARFILHQKIDLLFKMTLFAHLTHVLGFK